MRDRYTERSHSASLAFEETLRKHFHIESKFPFRNNPSGFRGEEDFNMKGFFLKDENIGDSLSILKTSQDFKREET